MGDIGETRVLAELIKRGYNVSIPFGHDAKYDLVVEVDGKLKKVQVKTTASKGGKMRVQCRTISNIIKGKQIRVTYTKKDFDYMIVYDTVTDACYNVPMDDVEQTIDALWLRTEPPKNGNRKNIRWAKDYLLTESL